MNTKHKSKMIVGIGALLQTYPWEEDTPQEERTQLIWETLLELGTSCALQCGKSQEDISDYVDYSCDNLKYYFPTSNEPTSLN